MGLLENIKGVFSRSGSGSSGQSSRDESLYESDMSVLLEDAVASNAMPDDKSMWQVVEKLRNISEERHNRYNEYDIMEEDVIISSALEMYADDATQIDMDTSKKVWVESKKNNKLAEELNKFLEALDVDKNIWGWAYRLAKYGDLYLNVFFESGGEAQKISDYPGSTGVNMQRLDGYEKEDGEGEEEDTPSNMEDYVETVDDPSTIFNLVERGKTVAFVEVDKDDVDKGAGRADREGVRAYYRLSQKEVKMYHPMSFVHFSIDKGQGYDSIVLYEMDESALPGMGGGGTERIFKVARGSSLLGEVRSIYRILRSLENTVILSRIVKSAFVRIISLEVGKQKPTKVRQMVTKMKQILSFSEKMNMDQDQYSIVRSPGMFGEPIVIPVRDNVGSIKEDTIGADYDVKKLTDIEYFNNKFFAGLKIPKSFMGFEEAIPGDRADSRLTMLDIRYSRTIKRLVSALIEGLETLLNIYLISNGKNNQVNNFVVKMVPPSSVDQVQRREDKKAEVDVASQIQRLVTDLRDADVDQTKLLRYMLVNYVGMDEESVKEFVNLPVEGEEGEEGV